MQEGGKQGGSEWGVWQSWLEAWNRHDLESILAHYAEDIVFFSPAVVELGISHTGSVTGKAALRELFAVGLRFDQQLRFEPLCAFRGVGQHALHYVGLRRRQVIEIHELNAAGLITVASAYHGGAR
jgi:hypothetical protein